MHDRTRDMRVGSVLNVEYFHRNQEQVPASSTQTLGRSNPSTAVRWWRSTRVEISPSQRAQVHNGETRKSEIDQA